jgi:hypothetical protein
VKKTLLFCTHVRTVVVARVSVEVGRHYRIPLCRVPLELAAVAAFRHCVDGRDCRRCFLFNPFYCAHVSPLVDTKIIDLQTIRKPF